MKLRCLIPAMSFAILPASAEPLRFESDETPAMLIELFTSEGCSSCPPADSWIGQLKNSPDLWKRIVPAVFHVDYWDRLGWPDRFASAANTERQQRYAQMWQSNSVYTPGFALNGREWRGWFERKSLPNPSTDRVGKLAITVQGSEASISFEPSGAERKALTVELALLGSGLESDVKRGENSGRKLKHDFTVLHHFTKPLRTEGRRWTATMTLPTNTSDPPKAIAAWIVPEKAQPPIQATGGWLR
jgi:hypothetical protein